MTRRMIQLGLYHAMILVLGGSLMAQYNYGVGHPGSGGLTPRISCGQAWMGNANFSIKIDQAIGAGTGYLLVSPTPSNTTLFGGLPFYVDVNNLFSVSYLSLGGTPGVAGDGYIDFPAPLDSFGVNPSLAGVPFFCQSLVFDSAAVGGAAMSPGLILYLTMPPEVFVGSALSGSSDPAWLVDPQTAAVKSQNNSVGDNCDGAVFTTDGLDLYINSSITPAIRHADLSVNPPSWSTLMTFAPGTNSYGLAIDELNGILWCVADLGGGSGLEFVGIDVNENSLSYGIVLYSAPTTALGGSVGIWHLTSDLKIVAPEIFSGDIEIFDMDPTSGTFLQNISTITPPGAAGGPFGGGAGATAVTTSLDGDQLIFSLQGLNFGLAQIARYSQSTGAWFDHDLSAPGIQNMGPSSSPPVILGSAASCLSSPRFGDSDFFVVSGFGGNGWAARIDFDVQNPNFWSVTPASGTSLNAGWFCAVNPEGTMVAITTLSGSSPRLRFFDAKTMSHQFTVPLLGGSGYVSGANLKNPIWR